MLIYIGLPVQQFLDLWTTFIPSLLSLTHFKFYKTIPDVFVVAHLISLVGFYMNFRVKIITLLA